ncbi:hypothetical protein TNCV_508151 [Trichonephila clavipes]|nr:hypothetical protein TNCV_508151 [Trichonephila clavipes]
MQIQNNNCVRQLCNVYPRNPPFGRGGGQGPCGPSAMLSYAFPFLRKIRLGAPNILCYATAQNHQLTTEERDSIIELHELGLSLGTIATRVGHILSTIQRCVT